MENNNDINHQNNHENSGDTSNTNTGDNNSGNSQEVDDVVAMKRAATEEAFGAEPPVIAAVSVDVEGKPQSPTSGNAGRKLLGKKVETTFGVGVVLDYRSRDKMYVIKIENNGSSSSSSTSDSGCGCSGADKASSSINHTTLYTVQVPKVCAKSPAEIANELNVAYEALEKMRRLNLDVQCHEMGIPSSEVDYDYCTQCLLANKGSTKSHFPRLQRFVDSANEATNELDARVQEQLPRLHNFFNATAWSASKPRSSGSSSRKPPPAPTTNSNDAMLQEQFPVIHRMFNPRSSASSSTKMANRISASLQEVSNLNSANNSTSKAKASTDNSEASSSASSSSAKKPAASNLNRVAATATKQKQSSTPGPMGAARAASSAKSPPPQPNAASRGLRKFWGSIQSLPQPAAARNPSSSNVKDNDAGSLDEKSSLKSSASTVTTMASSTSSSQKLPGIQGILSSSVATTIFGENKVKEDGSSADPNIIMQNRSSSLATALPAKAMPIKSDKPIALPRIQRLINKRNQANTSPCLICGSPSCPSCSSPSFRKEGITLCLKCERLFELDFIVDCVTSLDATQRAERIEYMVDCYDRCMLLLQYSTQFADQIASSLEDRRTKQDKIGLASSSVGVLSGVLGIAAAATILTPAGPPLLIASLFFGGSATTVQSGTEVINFLSEPRKLADRIIALHGMALSILRVTSTLRDAMLRDHIRTDVYEVEPQALRNQVKQSYEKNKTKVVMGSNFGRSLTIGGYVGVEASAAGAGVAAVGASEISAAANVAASAGRAGTAGATASATGAAAAGRSATSISRAGTAAATGAVRFARFAGGALSAAVLVMEANAIHSTVKSIRDGSPCDKADTLRKVIEEIKDFPSTSDLDGECQAYLNALECRPPPPVEVCALSDDLDLNEEIPEAECQSVVDVQDSQLCAPGAVILNEEDTPNAPNTEGQPTAGAVPVSASGSSLLGGSSLFQRLQARREERRSLATSAAEEVVAVAVDDNQLGESNFSLVL